MADATTVSRNVKTGPRPDKLTIWPLDEDRYGLDATFQGVTGYERSQQHEETLKRGGIPHTFRQELDGGWTLRLGPVPAANVMQAVTAFIG
ncbi:MAG TPA: hypothetical protein VIC05_07345 [Solirubrobacteraceae bacterium]|jgi:hypothetical protein